MQSSHLNVNDASYNTVTIVRYAEIALKGKNRGTFEQKLIKNIKRALQQNNREAEVFRIYGRLLVYGDHLEFLIRVFGIDSISTAAELPFDIELLKNYALHLCKEHLPASFRIDTQRVDKTLPLTSMEVNQLVGGFVHEQTNIPVSLKMPDFTVFVELINRKAYVFTEKKKGFSGLPTGIEGAATITIESGRDILAGLFMMKRGCELVVINPQGRDLFLLKAFGYREHTVRPLPLYCIQSNLLPPLTQPNTFYPLVGYTDEELHKALTRFKSAL